MSKVIAPGMWISDEDYERLIVTASHLRLEECVNITGMTDSGYAEHLMRDHGVSRVGMATAQLDPKVLEEIENAVYGEIS
jgi:hypothetical protein